MKTVSQFEDSALAMIADLELSHGVSFTVKESESLRAMLAESAQRFWWSTKQGKRELNKRTRTT